MIFLDTGYLIALLNPRDELHPRAQAWANRLDGSLLLTDYILWETINFFSSPTEKPKVHALVEQLRADTAFEILPATTVLFEAGLRLHRERADKAWSLTDCVSFVVMHERGVTQALAFDQHFEQAGFEALLRRNP